MKKVAVLGMIVLFLSIIFAGCSSDSEPEPVPESMTFVDNNLGREFTINENFEFTARMPAAYLFSILDPELDVTGMTGFTSVSGDISRSSGSWTSSPLTGMAGNLTSDNRDIREQLQDLPPVSINMTYVNIGGEITAVNITFPGAATDPIAGVSQALMGGSYTRR